MGLVLLVAMSRALPHSEFWELGYQNHSFNHYRENRKKKRSLSYLYLNTQQLAVVIVQGHAFLLRDLMFLSPLRIKELS